MKVYTNWQDLPDNPMRCGDSDYNAVMKTEHDDYEDELSLDDVLRINDAASLMVFVPRSQLPADAPAAKEDEDE